MAGEAACVEVWAIDLDADELVAPDRLAWLDAQEHDRHQRFVRPADARHFAAAHTALRDILGRHVGERPASLRFEVDRWGKPRLPGGPPFNLSHAAGRALVALGRTDEIGVDLEPDDRLDGADWFRRVLSPGEASRLAGPAFESLVLTRLWTRKEAVVKALGRGLSLPPEHVAVPITPLDPRLGGRALATIEGRRRLVVLHDLPLGPGWSGALASTGPVGSGPLRVEPYRPGVLSSR